MFIKYTTHLAPTPKIPARTPTSVVILAAFELVFVSSDEAAEYNSETVADDLEVIVICRTKTPPTVCTPVIFKGNVRSE